MIKLQCACGHVLNLPEELSGKKIRCKHCQKVLRVPESKAACSAGSLPSPETSFSDPALMLKGSQRCLGCQVVYPPGVVVCVECGINLKTGAQLYVSMGERPAPGAQPPIDSSAQKSGWWRRLFGKRAQQRGNLDG